MFVAEEAIARFERVVEVAEKIVREKDTMSIPYMTINCNYHYNLFFNSIKIYVSSAMTLTKKNICLFYKNYGTNI